MTPSVLAAGRVGCVPADRAATGRRPPAGRAVSGLTAVAALAIGGSSGGSAPGGGGAAPAGGAWALGAVVALVAAGASIAWAAAAHRRRRAAERAAAAQAQTLDHVRSRLLAALEGVATTGGVDPRSVVAPLGRPPGAWPDDPELRTTSSLADDPELRSTSSLADDLAAVARAAVVGRRADARAASARLEQLGWGVANLAARQRRLLSELEAGGGRAAESSVLGELAALTAGQQRQARAALVLAGVGVPGPGSRPSSRPCPAPLADVLARARAGLGPTERIVIGGVEPVDIRPGAADDVAHVLCVLLEEALDLSPPPEVVTVDAQRTPHGVRIHVARRGERTPARQPPGGGAGGACGLGPAVVERLATRHGFTCSYEVGPPPGGGGGTPSRQAAGGATTTTVDLPDRLLVAPEPVALRAAAPRPTRSL